MPNLDKTLTLEDVIGGQGSLPGISKFNKRTFDDFNTLTLRMCLDIIENNKVSLLSKGNVNNFFSETADYAPVEIVKEFISKLHLKPLLAFFEKQEREHIIETNRQGKKNLKALIQFWTFEPGIYVRDDLFARNKILNWSVLIPYIYCKEGFDFSNSDLMVEMLQWAEASKTKYQNEPPIDPDTTYQDYHCPLPSFLGK